MSQRVDPQVAATHAGNLLVAVIASALWNDRAEDVEWVCTSPVFRIYCRLLGLSDDLIDRIQQAWLRGEVEPSRLLWPSLAASRGGYQRPEDPVWWQGWQGGGLHLKEQRR